MSLVVVRVLLSPVNVRFIVASCWSSASIGELLLLITTSVITTLTVWLPSFSVVLTTYLSVLPVTLTVPPFLRTAICALLFLSVYLTVII